MVIFGASGCYFYSSAACFTRRITELMVLRFTVCYLYSHCVLLSGHYDEDTGDGQPCSPWCDNGKK